MSPYFVGMLFSAWAAVEGYDLSRKYPEEHLMSMLGTLMLIVGTVLFVVDLCVLVGG